MSDLKTQLKAAYGGLWDGGSSAGRSGEIHGLIERGSARLKIELTTSPAGPWTAAIFEAGTCIAAVSDVQALRAVADALDSVTG